MLFGVWEEDKMKILMGALIGGVGSYLVILLDIKFVKWLFSLVPNNEYSGLVKILIVFIDFWFTAGLCIIPFVLGCGIGTILEKE